MTFLHNSTALAGASGNQGGYTIAKSLRFRSSASAYLSRTPASASNRKTWTWSAWVKRGTIGARQALFGTTGGSDSLTFFIGFDGSDRIEIDGHTLLWRLSTSVYRDPAAWYHIVLAVDTTQSTASNRIKLYVNNVQVTSFGTSNDPSLNADLGVNYNAAHYIGQQGSTIYHDGYHAEAQFVDGQQLTPSSFGETDLVTGVWQPKKYAGTYGTNGFYLPFTDVATTSGSNAGLGKDFSGNGNYWNTNNISVTAGATYDSVKDVPTLTDADTANYCVMNPLRPSSYGAATLSDGNLKVSQSAGAYVASTSTMPMSSGKWYWEVNCGTAGFVTSIGITTNIAANGFTTGTATYHYDGTKYLGASNSAYGSSYTGGDTLGFALDMGAGTLVCYKNNVSQGTLATGLTGDCYAYATLYGTNNVSFNFGQRPFAYTPPTGFKALNTFNLPEPSIKAGNKHFDVKTYVSTGSTLSLTGFNFQPDFGWFKHRQDVRNHALVDSVRGTGGYLFSNLTNAEETSITDAVTSFNSDGFTLGANTSGTNVPYTVNEGGGTANEVVWAWKANGSAVSNTAGSITSQVSANASAGFSVVTYTGNASVASFGHGLGVAPKMIIIKNRSASGTGSNWCVGLNIPGWNWATDYLYLNTVGAKATDGGTTQFYSAPTSSVVNIGGGTNTNGSGNSMVAYCFSEVTGYSKFGSYTGNGSTDGPFVHLGFKPKFLIIKSISAASNWNMFDSSRDTYNMNVNSLVADAPDADANWVNFGNDFLSNGFKMRTNWANLNTSGNTYIYMAFAEVPSKYANAR